MKKVGIVLSGGGAKGAFEIGVLEVLLNKIKKDGDMLVGISGTSIGAFNGVFVASNQFEFLKNTWLSWNKENCPLVQYSFLSPVVSLLLNGYMYDAEPLRKFLASSLDFDALQMSNSNYINTRVRLGDGELFLGGNRIERFEKIKLVLGVMASMAFIPGTPSVNIEGTEYGDGGFRDTIPVKALVENTEEMDVIYVISVNPEKRKWNKNILGNPRSALIERLNFLLNDILWDDNNRADIEIGRLKFWKDTKKYVTIFPEFVNLTTDNFDSQLIKEAYLHGIDIAHKTLV